MSCSPTKPRTFLAELNPNQPSASRPVKKAKTSSRPSASASLRRVHILMLPSEILEWIYECLDCKELISSVQYVCKDWAQHANSTSLWQKLAQSRALESTWIVKKTSCMVERRSKGKLFAGTLRTSGQSVNLKKVRLDVTKHIQRSFHWWFFQQADLPEQALMANDMAFIDYLWQYWCVPGFEDKEHIKEVKACLRQPGVLHTALVYYRAMFDTKQADPALGELREAMQRRITLPTLALCGADDLRAELMREQAAQFAGPYEYKEVPHAGHFLHREQSKAVNTLLLDWLSNS